jgi:hypothetical protein
MAPIDPFETIAELRRCDCDDAVRRRGPEKAALLQALGVERRLFVMMPLQRRCV